MDKGRLIIIGAVAAMVVVVAFGWFLGVQPQLAAAADSDSQRQSVAVSNDAQQKVLDQLVTDSAQQADFEAKLAVLEQSVPSDSAFPALLDAFNEAAAASGVTLSGFTPSVPTPYVAGVGDAAAPASAPAASSDQSGRSTATPTPAPTTSAPPVAAASEGATVAPPAGNPLISSSNLVTIPLEVGVKGGMSQVIDFVHRVQTGKRLFLVNAIHGGSDGAAEAQDYSVSGYVYVVIDPNAAAPTAEAAAQ